MNARGVGFRQRQHLILVLSRFLNIRCCSSSISNAFAFESLPSSASDSSVELCLISNFRFNKMSGTIVDNSRDQVLTDCTIKNDDNGGGALENMLDSDVGGENAVPSPKEEEEIIKKKYGGLLPKKPPLIYKDHEHAFFDSADWALGKQGAQKPKGPLEALRPKLQPTPHHQGRSRSAYAPADDGNEGNGYRSEDPEDESHKAEDASEKDLSSEEKRCQDEPHDVLC